MDEEDLDDSATALREAKEEIGLKSNLVQVITNLEPFISLVFVTFFNLISLLYISNNFYSKLISTFKVDTIIHKCILKLTWSQLSSMLSKFECAKVDT